MASIWRRLDSYIFFGPKVLYITMSFAFYAFYLMRANFSTNYLGFSRSQFGDLSAMMAAVGFLSMAPWGKVADATGRHRLVLAFCTFGMASSFMLFLFRFSNPTTTFVVSAFILALYSFFSVSLQPMTDYHALKMLEDHPGVDRDCYGRQRVWGTIAYGFISYVMGYLVKRIGPEAAFYVVPSTAAVFIVTIYLVTEPDRPVPLGQLFGRRRPSQSAQPPAEAESKDSLPLKNASTVDLLAPPSVEDPLKSLSKSPTVPSSPRPSLTQTPLVRLLTNPNYVFLLVFVFLSGSARAVMTNFAAMYWNEDMKLQPDQVAIAANFGILMEIVLFFMAPLLLRFLGIYWMLLLSQLSMAARCWLYAVLPARKDLVAAVYAIELLKGMAFGFAQIAGVKIIVDVAPPGLEATAQAVYTSFYSQLPAVLAAAIGGRLYQWYGAKTLFLTTAIISSVAFGLFFLKYAIEGRLFGRCTRPASPQHL